MKYIREGRLGPPKSFKTGAVVGTYPKPMLCLMFDQGGLDVIPSRISATGPIKMDCVAEDIVWCTPAEFPAWAAKPADQQPKILAVNFFSRQAQIITEHLRPVADPQPMRDFVAIVDLLYKSQSLPWKTIVLDSVTGYMDIVLSLIAAVNLAALADARQWAYQVGTKVKQAIAALTCLNAHVVVIMHSIIEKNETTSQVSELANIYSQLRQEVSYLFSQFFYATQKAGRPIIWTTDQMYVKGLGPRWPVNLPAECQPDFQSIYGKESV